MKLDSLKIRSHRAVGRASDALVSIADERLIRSHFPDLERITNSHRSALATPYAEYVRNVSSAEFAISLELASVLGALCEARAPSRIIDLGTGFSSAVFRMYQQASSHPVTVWSIDDSADWLERTRRYLASLGLPIDHLALATQRLPEGIESADLILHDIGKALRVNLLPDLTRRLRPGGAIVFDDMHRRGYRKDVHNIAAGASLRMISLRRLTLDPFKRFSEIGVAPAERVPSIS